MLHILVIHIFLLAEESKSLAKEGYDNTGKAFNSVGESVEQGWDNTKSASINAGKNSKSNK